MSSELGVERPTTLPLPEPQEARRVHFGDVNSAFITDERTHSTTPFARVPDFRPKRSRSASFSAGEFRYGNKRRKKYRVLPSKFLLGGNITDPLNLGSLDREEASQLGLVEGSGGLAVKKSDAVRVIIPPNINDPLNLDVSSDNEDSLNDALLRQLRRRRRSRKRKRRLSEPSGEIRETLGCEPLRSESLEECQIINSETELITPVSEVLPKLVVDKLQPLSVDTELSVTVADDQQKEPVGLPTTTAPGAKPSTSGFQRPAFKKQRCKSDNKIVSPVIPQPGVDRKRHPSHSRQYAEQPHLSQQNLKLPKKFNPKNELFQYGNYNKYYGYRNPDMTPDMRLNYLRREWFDGKEVLDVGCNIGHITLTIARDFNPKSVVGLDIDKKLVNIAQKNIKHYMQKGNIEETNFPKSMKLLYGPLKPPVTVESGRRFPYNVKFLHANYVLESDELLETVRPEFDVVMCLSITKWVHLNWGDSGLKRFFSRIFYNLKPGGRLILEPQGWPSYNKRKKLTMRIFENFKNIRLFPDKFNDYLLHTVGFSTSEKIITPQHMSRGFQRPIIVYTKAGVSAKSSSALDKRSIEFSTKCGDSLKRLDFSAVPNAECASSEIDQKIKEESPTVVRSENNDMNSVNDTNTEGLDLAQKKHGSDVGLCSKVSEVKVEIMDCLSNSQCSIDKNEVTLKRREELISKEGNGDFVCDNLKNKSSSDNSSSLLTHSPRHNADLCVVKLPSCSSENEDVLTYKSSSSSNLCKKTETNKGVNSSVSEPGNDMEGDAYQPQNLQSASSIDKGRTSLGSNHSTCLIGTTEAKICETRDTVNEISHKSKLSEVGKYDGLLSVKESRSPEK